MRRLLLFVIGLLVLAQAQTGFSQEGGGKASHAQANLDWRFDMRRLKDEVPDTKVYLIVNGRPVFIMRAASQFTVLTRDLYKSHGAPQSAVTACSGWWAGQGQDLYVIRRKGQLMVYMRDLDEQAPIPAFTRLKVIPMRR